MGPPLPSPGARGSPGGGTTGRPPLHATTAASSTLLGRPRFAAAIAPRPAGKPREHVQSHSSLAPRAAAQSNPLPSPNPPATGAHVPCTALSPSSNSPASIPPKYSPVRRQVALRSLSSQSPSTELLPRHESLQWSAQK